MSAPQGRMQEHDSRSANAGSRTMTVSPAPEAQAGPSTQPHAVGTLRLRGAPLRRPKVTWTDETVDNEGMGKKKSKICCIYHKPKAYDESSSESESETDDDPPKKQYPKAKGHALRERNSQEVAEVSSESDGGAGNGKARPTRKPHRHGHNCDHGPRDPPKANKYDQKASSKDT